MTQPPVELAAIERGAGTLVTLIHGGVFHSGPAWARSIGPLAQAGCRVIAVDRRGYGRSPAGGASGEAPGETTGEVVPVSLQAEDVATTLEQRGAASAHVAGVSYGALVALELALRHPEQVRSLTLVEPALFAWLRDDPDYTAWIARFSELEAAGAGGAPPGEWLAGWLGLMDPELARTLVPSSASWPLVERAIARLGVEESAGTYRPDPGRLSRLAVPTLVVNGADTEPALGSVGQLLSERIPGAEHVDIPGAGHQVHAREAETFNELLLLFAARNRAPRHLARPRPAP